jgi:cobaltochelatase CobN
MTAITFVFTHPSLGRLWEQARLRLAEDGIEVHLAHQMQVRDWKAFAAGPLSGSDIVYLDVTRHFGSFDILLEAAKGVSLVVPASLEARAALPLADTAAATSLQAYVKGGSAESIADGVCWLLFHAGLHDVPPAPPVSPVLVAVYHPAAPETIWRDASSYLAWTDRRTGTRPDAMAVALISDRNAWLNGDREATDRCIDALEAAGLIPVPIFCDSEIAAGLGAADHPLTSLIGSAGDRLGAIWNAAFLHGKTAEDGEGGPFARHDVPVLQLVRNWSATEAEWRAGSEGLSPLGMAFSLTRPEMMGAVDPTVFAASLPADPSAGEQRRPVPLDDQIERLAGRTASWIRLRRSPNGDKRIAIMLHNPPCKAAEATIGSAASLDALQSVVVLLRRLEAEGYTVNDIPESGAALLKTILARKAICEFRWTNVEEIRAKGGALAEIDEGTYRADFDRLPAAVRERVDAAWGPFPAKSMVHDPNGPCPTLVISGLRFGKVLVMVDPKRGCWGPKCDGEVCRILHEPDIAPPHHWLATFWYLQKNVDALVIMGADGPLEYLPGKRVGLSEACFPNISLGDLPVIYPYPVNNVGEGMIAKRRGRAVLVDHLSAPVAKADAVGRRWYEIEELHRQYLHADAQGGVRKDELAATLKTELVSLGLLAGDADAAALALAIEQIPRRLASMRGRTLQLGLHTLGMAPDDATAALYCAEAQGLGNRAIDTDRFAAGLAGCPAEIDAVVAALSGRFVHPGPSGHLSRGRVEILPTGRNFYGIDLSLLPTAAACEVGARMGEKLLRTYLDDEGGFPQTIGITLWSSDAFQADGELAAQILWMMGCAPRYDDGGKVTGIEVTPLDAMTLALADGTVRPRPRIDVVVQMSSVVRDVLPGIYTLFDKAVQAVSSLDESAEQNFVRAHVAARMEELKATLTDVGEAGLKRLASYRCFSDRDGAYGSGVSLALDASAWEDDADLAEVLVNWNGHAFGADGRVAGEPAAALLNEYAGLVRHMDISYQRAASGEGDILAYGCYVDTQGGAAAAKRGLGGGAMRLYWGDTHTSAEGEVRSVKEEIALSLATSLASQEWFEEIKKRGYAGGTEVGARANHLFAWSATTHEVAREQFDVVHDMYVANEKNRAWLKDNNIYALEELTRRLLEAQARGLWAADERRLEELRAAVLDLEGDIEEAMGPVKGEFQGASVDIKSRASVKEWSYEFRAK